MEALRIKYEQNKVEVLSGLDVSKKLLDLMMEKGLLDDLGLMEYQNIRDANTKNEKLMKVMLEGKIEDYMLFVQCLSQAGQDKVAKLLTDLEEESSDLNKLHSALDSELGAIAEYLQQEEKRAGLSPAAGGTNPKHELQSAATADPAETTLSSQEVWQAVQTTLSSQEVWQAVQTSLEQVREKFRRYQEVIDKLHNDCKEETTINADMMTQVGNCYNRVKQMMKLAGIDTAAGHPGKPKNTQLLFQNMIEDVNKLMSYKSKALQEEHDGRTTAMRMLRHMRDMIQERLSILNTSHQSTGGVSPRQPQLPILREQRRYNRERNGSFSSGSIQKRTVNISKPKNAPLVESALEDTNPYPISSVLEGLHLLQKQVSEYTLMEIKLTDKYRAELRSKHLRKKSLGFTSRGLEEAERAMGKLEAAFGVFRNDDPRADHSDGDGTRASLYKLRASLDTICDEYNECAQYVTRVTATLPAFPDVDKFVKKMEGVQDAENKQKKEPDTEKPRCSFFKKDRKPDGAAEKPQTKGDRKKGESQHPLADPLKSSSKVKVTEAHSLTHQESSNGEHSQLDGDGSLLSKLKILVANHEKLKQRMNGLEDRYLREFEHKRRSFDAILHAKSDDFARLEIKLKEAEAERDKYRTLYEKVKISYVHKTKK